MDTYQHAGMILKALRLEMKLSQKQLSIRTQLVDGKGKGISETVLSQIEHGERLLTAKYIDLIAATGVFSSEQMEQLYNQAIADMIHRRFGTVLYLRPAKFRSDQ